MARKRKRRRRVIKTNISVSVCVRAPAAQCGLQKGGDPHAEENSPYQLTGGPLIETNTHGLGEEEGHGDGSAETCQVVLPRRDTLVKAHMQNTIVSSSSSSKLLQEFVLCTSRNTKTQCKLKNRF